MKQRMIVMNGFRILQSHNGQGWETVGTIKKVEKGIVAGVYNIFLSKEAEANNTVYEGIILYIDKEKEIVYQKVDKEFITHKLKPFKTKPTIGKNVSIRYDNNQLNLTLENHCL
ncbi:MAG: conjugal transfer protein TraO [Nitrosomonas sp.]|nr:conjugal transfer protein TraO [Nitrosomonas sp.]